jgi:predicted porin
MSFPHLASEPLMTYRFPRAQTLLATATLLACAGAHAQSSVQAYGLIDASVGQFQDAGAAKDKTVASGKMTTSYLGFKGSEDLGGGLKGVFTIESFLRADSGSAGRFNGDAFWARNANVGLSGSLGTVTAGRNTTSLFVSTLLFNALGDSFGFSPSIRHYFTSGTVTGDTGWNNSISYSSPRFGGLSAQLQVAGNDGLAMGRRYGGNVLYFGGAVAGTFAFQKVKAGTTAGTTTWQLGGSYDAGFAKLFGQYGKVANDTTNVDYKLGEIGVSVPVGTAGKLLAEYGKLSVKDRKTLSLGYDHAFSKRTDGYVVYMNDKLPAVDAGNSFALGIRHKF